MILLHAREGTQRHRQAAVPTQEGRRPEGAGVRARPWPPGRPLSGPCWRCIQIQQTSPLTLRGGGGESFSQLVPLGPLEPRSPTCQASRASGPRRVRYCVTEGTQCPPRDLLTLNLPSAPAQGAGSPPLHGLPSPEWWSRAGCSRFLVTKWEPIILRSLFTQSLLSLREKKPVCSPPHPPTLSPQEREASRKPDPASQWLPGPRWGRAVEWSWVARGTGQAPWGRRPGSGQDNICQPRSHHVRL